jgi:hypothetical protein
MKEFAMSNTISTDNRAQSSVFGFSLEHPVSDDTGR